MSSTSSPDLAVPVRPEDHSLGPSHAPITVVEYGDFECPNCKQAAPAVKLLLARFPGRVRFVFRHFPLEEVHPHALGAAEAAECAAAQDHFWPMHDRLFENQDRLQPRQLHAHAEALQLEMIRYDAAMQHHLYLQRIREQMDGARRSGVRGTPAFFVNGRIQDVSFGLRALFDAVESSIRPRGDTG